MKLWKFDKDPFIYPWEKWWYTNCFLFVYSKPSNITGFYQSRATYWVAWFRYGWISFQPMAVCELRWIIVFIPCMNDYFPLRALWSFSCTYLISPNVKRWTKLVVTKSRERLWHWVKILSCYIGWRRKCGICTSHHYRVNDCRENPLRCTLPHW